VSQRDDLLTQLRETRPMAPAELREHVRGIAGEAAPARRRGLTWRRALIVAVPVAAAVAGVAVLFPGGKSHPVSEPAPKPFHGAAIERTAGAASVQSQVPVPAPNRVQRITTSLELRLPSTPAVSDASKRAVAITRSLGGYAKALNVDAEGRTGYASLVLRIPKHNLRRAVARLSALGTIIGENVRIQDLQAQVDAMSQKIARLETLLSYWQHQPASTGAANHVATLTGEIARLRRAHANTIHAASYATVALQMTTRPAPVPVHKGHGPLHDLGLAFRWVGIGAVYVLALSAPFVLLGVLVWLVVRAFRRHRENELLSST
jgi:hypothetical protein